MKVRVLLLAAGALVAAAAGACGGPTQPVATHDNIFDTAGVYALTGAPESGPTAVATLIALGGSVFGPSPVRAVPGTRFDVAFDIRDTVALALPPMLVGFQPFSAFNGFLQLSSQPYDSMSVAPTDGYSDSTPIVIHAGSSFYVQSLTTNPACTAQSVQARRYIYSKFHIDSINFAPYDPVTSPNGRTIYYRMVVDPNCGFLGLDAGIPSE
jgi:hypothetical protein